jgi:hypothetical protein
MVFVLVPSFGSTNTLYLKMGLFINRNIYLDVQNNNKLISKPN